MDRFSAFITSSDSSFSVPPEINSANRQLFDEMSAQPSKPTLPEAATPQTAGTALHLSDCVDESIQSLLKESLRKAQEWEQHLPINHAENKTAIQLRILVENLISVGNPSILAMCNVRTLLCANCLQLKVTQGKCDGLPLQPLGRCLLLKGLNS